MFFSFVLRYARFVENGTRIPQHEEETTAGVVQGAWHSCQFNESGNGESTVLAFEGQDRLEVDQNSFLISSFSSSMLQFVLFFPAGI